ncbi:dynamin [Nannizzia gypsea CBS 118893]|uniref:Dynamin n=1 Tax=Arthroderma gypseum (strain ATCC MYA-4604 / CBS 118893) TaxID=535722 RepID=E4UW25_ARTGP|nr:dynamin [Nannizzia gypsea CBS 118893]EFR02473.1 dynamin [Nannizzia gypsea CBS 118893]
MIESATIKSKLNQIDKARARGAGDHISLPQLVVCGDQSAGKSSVLEGITEIPFPRKDGLCTRFATEIVLRHSPGEKTITATIIPHSSRDEATATRLRSYRKNLLGYNELPDVIEAVGALMGLRGFTDEQNAPPFALDVLRIEVIGETGLHLTIVDLPGLVSGAESDDSSVVENLVDSYLENSRTIILAVVPATSDVETQPIIRAARQFDKEGVRTVGIVTKTDLINDGTEDRIAAVAKNHGPIKLKLGYYLLKNPSPKEIEAGMTTEDRKRKELSWFQRPGWKNQQLNPDRVGIDALKSSLEVLLARHIENELPKVCSEILKLLEDAQKEVDELGEERPNTQAQRLFLTKLSLQFRGLVQAAAGGTYQGMYSRFFSVKSKDKFVNRIRARIHELNTIFSKFMRSKSHKYDLRQKGKDNNTNNQDSSDAMEDENDDDIAFPVEWGKPDTLDNGVDTWILTAYKNSRGLELSGTYGYTLLMELFHTQSSRWESIARGHTNKVHKLICSFVEHSLSYSVKEEKVRSELWRSMKAILQKNLAAALTELNSICEDEKMPPITYNHYYTDNIEKARHDEMKSAIYSALSEVDMGHEGVRSSYYDRGDESCDEDDRKAAYHNRLGLMLERKVIVDMDKRACEEAKTALNAYYKVAMKTFVDNICRQVIERHLISKLPAIFSPTSVLEMSDLEVARIAGEPVDRAGRRAELMNMIQTLSESLDDLQN